MILLLLTSGLTSTNGQIPNSQNLFKKPAFSQLLQLSPTPQPVIPPQTDIHQLSKSFTISVQQVSVYSSTPILHEYNNVGYQNKQQLQQVERDLQMANERAQQLAAIKNDIAQEPFYKKYMEWMAKTKSYQQAFKILISFNPDSFSVSKAVFTVENAFLGNKYSYESFETALKQRAELVKQILKRENLSPKNNTALNYGIIKLYTQYNDFYDIRTKQQYSVKPFRYDFEDFRGEKEYTKMFTTKMLSTGKGQCHSMPLVYLMIAEQLGAKAYLSLAPQHSFIQFADNANNLVNFETTNGNLVSTNWLQQSGFINANALKSKTYLDTLSQRKLYAQCLADLLLGYMAKFGYDTFAESIHHKIVQMDPNNLSAAVIDANVKTQIVIQKISAAGKPAMKNLPNYPEAYQAYLAMQAAYDKVDGMGYQDMPKEAYQEWLKCIDRAKQLQSNKEIQERLQREIEYLKKIQPLKLRSRRN